MVEIETGSIQRGRIANQPIPRPAGAPTPCDACPKCAGSNEKTPWVGRRSELSRKNRRTLELYHRNLAAPGSIGPVDSINGKNFGIIRELHEAYDRARQRRANRILEAIILARHR